MTEQPTPDDEHVCKPGASIYYCPTAGEIESDCHGGFDVCCDKPELHRPASLREQYAAAIDAKVDGSQGCANGNRLADVVLSVRDQEMEELRARVAELEKDAAITKEVLENADVDMDGAIQTARYFKALSEQVQAWGEQHRDRANRYRARTDVVRAELTALNSETAGLNPYAMAGRRDAVARIRDALHTISHETPVPDDPRVTKLAPMFEGLGRLLATSSRDWSEYRVDAWLWAVLVGWDCEEPHEHDDTCEDGQAMQETAERHGWDEETVAKVRRYRAAVRAVTNGT